MIELFTDMARTKMELNGGEPIAMSPLTVAARKIVREEYVDGMGGLQEDPRRGVRCPVCGVHWSHTLTRHANKHHAREGGAAGIKAALSIPASVSLSSSLLREKLRTAWRGNVDRRAALAEQGRKMGGPPAGGGGRRGGKTIMEYNGENGCPAQTAQALRMLAGKLGPKVTVSQARDQFGGGFVTRIIKWFGSWNAAKELMDLETNACGGNNKYGKTYVLNALERFYLAHGRLPTMPDVRRPVHGPVLPTDQTIMRHLDCESWPIAMSTAAFILGIDDPRYGPVDPKKASA